MNRHRPDLLQLASARFKNFTNRISENYTAKILPRKSDYQRARGEDPKTYPQRPIRKWFRLVQDTIEKYGAVEVDIYNFDKTVFQTCIVYDYEGPYTIDRVRWYSENSAWGPRVQCVRVINSIGSCGDLTLSIILGKLSLVFANELQSSNPSVRAGILYR